MGFAFPLSAAIRRNKWFVYNLMEPLIKNEIVCVGPEELWYPAGKWFLSACCQHGKGWVGLQMKMKNTLTASQRSQQGPASISSRPLPDPLQGFIAHVPANLSFDRQIPRSCSRGGKGRSLIPGSWQFPASDSSAARDKSQHFCITRKSHRTLQCAGREEGGGRSLYDSQVALSSCSVIKDEVHAFQVAPRKKVVPLHPPGQHPCKEGCCLWLLGGWRGHPGR